MEVRETSLVWNFKHADVEFGRLQARDLLQHLWTGPISNAPVEIIQGGRSVEVGGPGLAAAFGGLRRTRGRGVSEICVEQRLSGPLAAARLLRRPRPCFVTLTHHGRAHSPHQTVRNRTRAPRCAPWA